MQHVVGPKKTERQWLDVAFFLDLEMHLPEVGYEVVDLYQSVGGEKGGQSQ